MRDGAYHEVDVARRGPVDDRRIVLAIGLREDERRARQNRIGPARRRVDGVVVEDGEVGGRHGGGKADDEQDGSHAERCAAEMHVRAA